MRTYHAIYAWLGEMGCEVMRPIRRLWAWFLDAPTPVAALLFITIFVALVLLALEFGIKPNIRREHKNLIQLCLQATDYTHAQCEWELTREGQCYDG